MKIIVLGVKETSFKAKDGSMVKGQRVYYGVPSESVKGCYPREHGIFLSDRLCSVFLSPGDELDVSCDLDGKPREVTCL